MSILIKCFDELKTNRQCENLAEQLALNLLKEYTTPLDRTQLCHISNDLTEFSASHKVSAVYAVVSLLEGKFEETSDENYYLNVSNELVLLIRNILNFFIQKSLSVSFNTQNKLFSKTVESGLSLFIPLRKKSHDLGSSFMKECSRQIITLLTCQRLSFSIRREATILYAEEVSECDRKILKKITQTQSSLLSALVQWIPQCGDIQLQEAIIVIAVYNSASTPEKTSVIKKWFLNSEFDPAVESLSFSNLSASSRVCLNYINSLTKPKKVFTLACQKCFGDNYTLIYKPKDEEYKELWVDFNTSTKCINLIYTPDSAQKGWQRLLLYFDNIKSLECFSSNCLIKKDVDEYQLRFIFKKSVPVITQDRPYEFSGLTLIFIQGPLLKELIKEFLIFHFPNLDNCTTKMTSFKTPEPIKYRKEIKTPKSIIPGSKEYFSRKSCESEPPSRHSFLANSNEYFLKYKNITPNDKSKSVENLEKSMSFANTNDEYREQARVGNSFLKGKRTNSVTSSLSSSFITDYAKVTSTLSGSLQKNILSHNSSWQSNSSPFRGFNDSSLRIPQEGGGKERGSYPHYQNTSDKENSERNIMITPRNHGQTCEKIDTRIVPDQSSDDDNDCIPVLRSAPARETSPINIIEASFSKNNGKITSPDNGLPSVLGEESDSSNMSDLCLQRPDFSTVRRFSEQLDKVPLPDYESDDSIIEDSQPKESGNKLLPRRSSEIFKSGSEKFLSDKTTPTHSSPLSKSEEDFFVTNKNRRLSKFSNQSVIHSDSDSSQEDFPLTQRNNLKDQFKTSSVQSVQEVSFIPKFVSKQSTKIDRTAPPDSNVVEKLESKTYGEMPSTLKNSHCKTKTDVLRSIRNSSNASAIEIPCQKIPYDSAVLSNKTSGAQIGKNINDECFKQRPKVIIKSALKHSSSRSKIPFQKATVEAKDVITVEDSPPIRKNVASPIPGVLDDQIHLPLNKVKEVKSDNYLEAEKLSIRESVSKPMHLQLYFDETSNQARRLENGKDKVERKNPVEKHCKKNDGKLNVPSIETEITSPKTSQFIQSQNSAFKPAIPMSKSVSASETVHSTKGRVEKVSIPPVKISCNKLKNAHDINKRQSTSPAILLTNPAMKKSRKIFSTDNAKSKELSVNLSPINPTQLNVAIQNNDIHRKGLTRPVIKVEGKTCSKIDNQSRLSLCANNSTFRPISRGTTPHAQCASREASSMRSTNASSKMELEQIFNDSSTIKSTTMNNVDSPNGQVKRKPTPFVRQSGSKIKAVKVVQDSYPISLSNPLVFESTALLAEKSVNSSNDCLEANEKNQPDPIVSQHNSSRMTVPASSGSDSSLFLSPYEGGSNNLNFTRLANTDANNNTLVGKKSLLTECSPAVLPMAKPSKTYVRKHVKKPNHAWFQTKDNKKKTSNKISVARPIKKKRLFHLPSNYQQSLSSNESPSVKVSHTFLRNEPKKIIKKEVKKVSPTLYDIKELNESSEEESRTTEVKEEMDEVINTNNRVRRSTRNRKKINYKEISDHETKKSPTLKSNQPTSRQSEASIIKHIILKDTDKNKNVTELYPTSLPAKRRKNIKMNSHGELIATEENIHKNVMLKKSDKSHRNKTVPAAEKEINEILSLEPELNNNYATEIVDDVRSSKSISKLIPRDKIDKKSCFNLDSKTKRTKAVSHKDIFDFDDEATETLELREIPLKAPSDSNNRQRKFKKEIIELSEVQSKDNDVEVYDDKKTDNSNLKRATECSSTIKLKKLKRDKDQPLADAGSIDEATPGRTSPTDSLVMENVTVEAMIHHPCPHDPTVKSRLKPVTSAKTHLRTEDAIEYCDLVEEELSSTSLQHDSNQQGDQNKNLLSLVTSIKKHIKNLSGDFNKLVEVLNPPKQK